MNDQVIAPPMPPTSPAARRRFFLRRIYPSTWLAMLLAAGVTFLVEFPGHRGFYRGTYSHGWPLVWIEGYDWGTDRPWKIRPGPPVDSGGPIVNVERNQWEESRDPWTLRDDMRVFDIGSLSVDFGISLVAVLLVGWLFQQWRKRHGSLLRYRLRTLLGFFALVAAVLAPLAAWHRESQREFETIEGLKSEIITGLAVREAEVLYGNSDRVPRRYTVAGMEVRTEWAPPGWLPDSLAKVGGLPRLFDRVSSLNIRGERFTEKTFVHLAELSHLTSLEIAEGELTDSSFDALARLAGLKRLGISKATVNDRRLQQLAALSQLGFLELGNADVSDEGLAALATFSHLGYLSITDGRVTGKGLSRLKDLSQLARLDITAESLTDGGIEAIEQLQSLQDLELRKTPLSAIRIESLPRLSVLSLLGNANLKSVDLSKATPLAELTIASGSPDGQLAYPFVRLGRVDHLKELFLDGATLDADDLSAIANAPYLWQLELQRTRFAGMADILFGRASVVFNLKVCETNAGIIRVEGSDNLRAVCFARNPNLTAVRLVDLPQVESVELADNPHLDLSNGLLNDLSALPRLRKLKLNCAHLSDRELAALQLSRNLVAVDLSNCCITGEGLTHLRNLSPSCNVDLSRTPVSDEAVAALQQARPGMPIAFEPKKPVVQDLRQQAAFVRNRLAKEIECKMNPWKLADGDFACLEGLENLESLDLSDTHLTDAGLEHLRRLPKLRELMLRRTQVTDAAVRTLKQMPALVHVDIEGTRMTDEGRRALGSLIAKLSVERN